MTTDVRKGLEGVVAGETAVSDVDGQKCQERATLGTHSRVVLDEYVFAVEMVGTRPGTA